MSKLLKRFFILIGLIPPILYALAEIVLINNNANHNIEAPILFQLTDLYYDNSSVKNASLEEFSLDFKSAGKVYKLYLDAETEAENSPYMKFVVYLCNSPEIADEILYEEIIALFELEQKTNCIYSKCYYPPLNYQKILSTMVPLDLIDWNIDEGYARKEIISQTNYFFLKKGNKVITLNIYNIEMNEKRIEILSKKIEESTFIFD